MARCMLKQKGMPHPLWGDVVTIAAYVLNSYLVRRLKNKVLEEVWSGKKSFMNYLKVIGSIFDKHVPDARRKKLNDKNEASNNITSKILLNSGLEEPDDALEVVINGVSELHANTTKAQCTILKDSMKKDSKASFCIQSVANGAKFDQNAHVEFAKEMGDNEKVAGYVSKVHNLIHLMKNYGKTMTDNMIIEKLEDLEGSLEARQLRIVKRKDVHEYIQALQAQTWKNNGGFRKFKGKYDKGNNIKKSSLSHSQKQKNDEKPGSSKRGGGTSNRKEKFDKKNMKCYNCDKWGHMAKECWYNKGKGATKDKDVDEAKIGQEDSYGFETIVFN
ncbi:uncharacterized protein LOC131635834 [Vicia villosa]|uniref:uncharacterized protein LOC131635834 n=1 Tax=Vicia villosa TaxID=3911 RepID=UPI00273C2B9C|nr:uncharacterized protein LOC131635834 [Vicia villosa]